MVLPLMLMDGFGGGGTAALEFDCTPEGFEKNSKESLSQLLSSYFGKKVGFFVALNAGAGMGQSYSLRMITVEHLKTY